MGYRNVNELWYSLGRGPVLEDSLELLSDDKGACHLMKIAMLKGQAHLFVIHMVCEPEYLDMLEYFPEAQVERHSGEAQVETHSGEAEVEIQTVENEVEIEVGEAEIELDPEEEDDGRVLGEVEAVGDVEGEVEVEVQADIEPKVQGELEPEVQADVEPEVQAELEPKVQGEVEGEVHDEYDVRSWNGSEEDVLTEDGDEGEHDIFESTDKVEVDGPRGLSESDWESDTLNNVVDGDEGKHDIFESTDKVEVDGPRGLSESDWECDTLNNVVVSDNTNDDREGYGDFG
ncbi:hypothetical protein LR48_Vigan02g065800 [Vigna angularis]|uniref:Uncharacterized protein n=1 Tax=Phaseolus angularis TaxID=3914 RepID=A0A0L9TVA7_PHAAN|nr:hypothetical protein LR48_Vigan02g065800 [Vigna angularis]